MSCTKCRKCGLVLENHDYVMSSKCVQDMLISEHEINMIVLRSLIK